MGQRTHPMTSPNPAPDEAVREIALLIEEYDPKNSDWYFRRTVIREILNRLAAAKPPASGVGAVAARQALEWYAEQVAGCRKLGRIGDPFRQALDKDGGKRATAALASLSPAATSGSEAGGEQWSAEQIATIWTAAMTAACNIVIHRQNDLNDEDGPMDVLNEQGQIIHQIKKWLEPDAANLEELRAMLGAKPAPAAVDGQRVKVRDWLAVARAAGQHGIRYRTNRALEAFLSEIRACLANEERADV